MNNKRVWNGGGHFGLPDSEGKVSFSLYHNQIEDKWSIMIFTANRHECIADLEISYNQAKWILDACGFKIGIPEKKVLKKEHEVNVGKIWNDKICPICGKNLYAEFYYLDIMTCINDECKFISISLFHKKGRNIFELQFKNIV